MEEIIYNCIFKNYLLEKLVIPINGNCSIKELIQLYFKKKEKDNLFLDNIEHTYFIFNSQKINYQNNENKVKFFFSINYQTNIIVSRLDYDKSTKDIEFIKKISDHDSVYTCVIKARYKGKIVAVKYINKKQLIEDIKEEKGILEITEEEFKKEISKFNRELKIMKECHCDNSVEIYDYYDTKDNFIIVMELCDDTLFKELTKTKNGFSPEKLKEILLQLNNVFKLMNKNNIAHRNIEIHNILIKYLNKEKTKFKVLLSDYRVSNQLSSMSQKFNTHAGTRIAMAPEILEGKEYNTKCDLWSLGVIIYQLCTKSNPYNGVHENQILAKIRNDGQKVLNIIKDEKLKNLLSKLLKEDPDKRISWEEYFQDDFFISSNIVIKKYEDITILETIKDSNITCVKKGKYKETFVALKYIKKEQLKEDIKRSKFLFEVSEEEFKKEKNKFERELEMMKKCYCDNSVEIYGHFDLEKYFIIVMELCDDTLFKELTKTKNGFTPKKIKEILLQLNNVFKLMNKNNIAHRDIKLHNILVKYLNKEKTEFKVLLSDYGVSNQLNSITQEFNTHAGTRLTMAPEILEGKEYNTKCDLWSLGVIIYQLCTKKFPFEGEFDNVILMKINKDRQKVLDDIKDQKLKDLLSKLLVKDPKKRISWEEYFNHKFFKN